MAYGSYTLFDSCQCIIHSAGVMMVKSHHSLCCLTSLEVLNNIEVFIIPVVSEPDH